MNSHSHLFKLVGLAMFLAGPVLRAQDNPKSTNAVVNAEAPVATNAAATSTNAASTIDERPAALKAAIAALPAGGAAAAAADTSDTRLAPNSFSIIQTRNIFNPNRRAPVVRDNTPPPPRTEYFTLNGIMTYEDKGYAFFDGSSGQYRRTLGHADSIAGYKISGITNNLVNLAASGNQTITMAVGMQMRRQGNGPWKLETRGESSSDSTASGGSGSDASADPSAVSPIFSGAQEDIATKLRARRAEEEKKTAGTNEDNKNDQNQ